MHTNALSQSAFSTISLCLFCLATGLSVAAVVYHQSMINLIAVDLQVPADSLWVLSVSTQVGYGTGLILGLPLGDMLPFRRLIPTVVLALGAVLLMLSQAPSLSLIISACFLAGLLSIGGQLLIAYSSKTVSPEARTQVVGALLSALFAGLLLARTLAGWGAEYIGWRAFYAIAGATTCLVALMLLGRIEEEKNNVAKIRYPALVQSLVALWLSTPELRRLALVAACFFAALNGIWANIASLMQTTLHWSSGQTGLLALTAIAGLGSASLINVLQQRLSLENVVIFLGISLSVASITSYWMGATVLMIIIFLAIADLTVRSVHVITQDSVLAINRAAASRLNSLFMTVFFLGAAIGSWLGGMAVQAFNWGGMFLFPMLCAIAGTAALQFGSTSKQDC